MYIPIGAGTLTKAKLSHGSPSSHCTQNIKTLPRVQIRTGLHIPTLQITGCEVEVSPPVIPVLRCNETADTTHVFLLDGTLLVIIENKEEMEQ